jgi:hypothetical protein
VIPHVSELEDLFREVPPCLYQIWMSYHAYVTNAMNLETELMMRGMLIRKTAASCVALSGRLCCSHLKGWCLESASCYIPHTYNINLWQGLCFLDIVHKSAIHF